MSTSTLGLFLRHLALSEEVSRLGTASDHDLLATYEGERGQAAFTELMRRHGPMVLRTCRRVLGQETDVEDAFQATFIFLAHQASQLRREAAGRQSLGSWLHRVAYRTSLKVLRGAVRRGVHERQAVAMTHSDHDPVTKATWKEIQPILDAELDALPDDARRLLIACYLQEKTYTEVGAELGLPRGSVARHLERARGLLARRLAQRGITVSAVLLAALLEESVKGAAVPAVLLVHTVEAARTFTKQASAIVSDQVAQLVKGGLAKMTKDWTRLSMVLAGWVSLVGAGLIACQTLRAWPEQKPDREPPAAERPAREEVKQTHTDRYGDPLPSEALMRLGTTRLRHSEVVYHVLFAPDGKTVASGGVDDRLHLWDVATGKLVRSLKHPERSVFFHPMSFARDGKTLTALTGNQIGLWDVSKGQLLRETKLKWEPNQHRQHFSLAVSSDGKLAASVGDDYTIQLWDGANGNPLRVLRGHGKSQRLLSFSPDNKTLASTEDDGKIVQLWDVSSGKLLHKLEHPLIVAAGSFSPDGKTLASGGSDTLAWGKKDEAKSQQWLKREGNPSAVRLWDVATGKLIRTLEGHQQFINALLFSPDGKVLASGSFDGTVRLWGVSSGKELRKLKCSSSGSFSFAPDGKMLAVAGNSPGVCLWDVTTGEELHCAGEGHTGQVCSVSFAPDGRTLATAASSGGDDTVRLWDAASGKPLRKLDHPGGAHSIAFAPDGKTLASGGEGLVCIWNLATGKPQRKLQASGGSPLAFSPDGKLLAAGANDTGMQTNGTLRLWDVATGVQLDTLEHSHPVLSVAFSPDGKTLATGTWGSVLYLWDMATSKELRKANKHNEQWGEIVGLSFSPDGKTLAVGCYDRKIHVLDVSTGKELHTLTGHAHQVLTVAFSPSGRFLASGSMDQTVRLWEMTAGLASECHQFQGHAAWVSAVAFSPDGRSLVSGSHDSTALVWDVTGLAGKKTPAPRLTPGELTALWRSLMDVDAARAYQSLRRMAVSSDEVVPFMAEQLVRKKPNPRRVARLLTELDSDAFHVRSRAAKELENLGEDVEPALRKALKDTPSVEVRRRILQLLETLEPIHPEGVSPRLLRWLRAVEVLEWIDTPASRKLLKELAAAPPREEVGAEARAALTRLHD